MFTGKYGPFTETMAILAALVTVFSVVLLKTVGKVSQWTFLAHDSPPFMVTAGARVLAIALIVATFMLIDKNNYGWFAAAAVVCGVFAIVLIGWFDKARKVHICKVPLLNEDGSQKKSWFGSPKFETVIIGSETDMKPEAAARYKALQCSLCRFLSGYGQNGVNDAGAIWTMETLAKNSTRLTMQLIGIFLFAAMAVYLAASSAEVHLRPIAPHGLPDQVRQ